MSFAFFGFCRLYEIGEYPKIDLTDVVLYLNVNQFWGKNIKTLFSKLYFFEYVFVECFIRVGIEIIMYLI